jgi:hypothetical protein
MATKDLPKFSIPGRIFMGVIAIAMIAWMLRLSGII